MAHGYVCVCICVCVCIYIYIYIYMYVFLHVCVCAYLLRVCMHAFMCFHDNMPHIHACSPANMHVCIQMHTHTPSTYLGDLQALLIREVCTVCVPNSSQRKTCMYVCMYVCT